MSQSDIRCAWLKVFLSSSLLCDKILRVRFRARGHLMPQFLAEAMKLRSVREHIESRLTGTSPAMKNISKPAVLDMRFPLPDAHTQQHLVDGIAASMAAASRKRTEAVVVRESAWTAFEDALFTSADEATT